MYLLLLLCIMLLGLYYFQVQQESFINLDMGGNINVKNVVDNIKQPHKHVNRIKRKLRKTREHIHKTHIRPIQVKIKRFIHG